ncbi:VOC family protein [Rhizobium leguminosarum]
MTTTQTTDRFGSSALHHVGWFTPDLERSIEFWTEVMGFTASPIQERRQPWIARLMGVDGAEVRLAHLIGHGGHIEFIQFHKPMRLAEEPDTRFQAAHICLRVRDVSGLCDDIVAHGGSLKGEITEIAEGVAAGLKGLYACDPHGVVIELIEYRDQAA